MRLAAVEPATPKPRRVHVSREKAIYALLERTPELLEKKAQFRLLSINKGPEKGPDFVAVNKKGHLVLGEIKRGSLSIRAWGQVKTYAKRFAKMRHRELNEELSGALRGRDIRRSLPGFLGSTAWRALLNPSSRRLQLVLVAKGFSDRVLRSIARAPPRYRPS